jgi:hypothetical protein
MFSCSDASRRGRTKEQELDPARETGGGGESGDAEAAVNVQRARKPERSDDAEDDGEYDADDGEVERRARVAKRVERG